MCHIGRSVALSHIVEHGLTAIVIKIDIDIRERYTVGVEETFEQQGRTSEGSICVIPRQYATTDPAAEPRPGPILTPNERPTRIKSSTIRKVTGETHGLHNMQFEPYALVDLVGKRSAIAASRALVGNLAQVVGLEFYTVEFLVTTEFLYFLRPSSGLIISLPFSSRVNSSKSSCSVIRLRYSSSVPKSSGMA